MVRLGLGMTMLRVRFGLGMSDVRVGLVSPRDDYV